MPEKIKFTKAALAAMEPSDTGYRYVYDSEQPGLAVSVGPNGPASYVVYRRVQGRPRRVTIAKVADMSPTEARREAAKVAGDIARGHDPTEDERRLKASVRFSELFADYVENHAKPRKRTWREDVRKYEKHLASLHKRKVSAIHAADIRKLHNRIKADSGPYEANRTLALLRVIFNHGDRQGMQVENPCNGIRAFKEHSRARFMDETELARFMEALDDEPDRDARDIFGLLLWTAARKGNVLAMKWDAVDLPGAVWRIPPSEAKGDDDLNVILPAPAVEILEARLVYRETMRRLLREKIAKARERNRPATAARSEGVIRASDTCVFPAASKSGHVVDVKKAWEKLTARAEITDLHIHDLRRTAASWAVAAGASLHVVGLALGHKDPDTTKVYARANLGTMRQAVDAGTSAMLAAVAKAKAETANSDTPALKTQETQESGAAE